LDVKLFSIRLYNAYQLEDPRVVSLAQSFMRTVSALAWTPKTSGIGLALGLEPLGFVNFTGSGHSSVLDWLHSLLHCRLSTISTFKRHLKQCWNSPKKTGGGGQLPQCLKFCPWIQI